MHSFLKGKIVPVASLSDQQRRTMYDLMVNYYDYIRWDKFIEDLEQKQDVILLLTKEDNAIKGFSTLMQTETYVNGRKVRAIFSGDTVVDEAYWGQRVLGRKFLSYLFVQSIKQPTSPLYWLLISKGYKTYLLMANNFREHYPRHEKATPAKQQNYIDVFARELFGDYYSEETGCCQFPESLGQLKSGVAQLSDEEINNNPRINFFLEKNPGWSNGDELVCIARMTWYMPFYYLAKSWWKLVTTQSGKGKLKPAGNYTANEGSVEDGAGRKYEA